MKTNTYCQGIKILKGERTPFLHIKAPICHIYYSTNIERKLLISLIEHCESISRIFCSTAPCKDADPSSAERSIDEMQEIGKLKVITSGIVSNDF